jgi:hypothetical protein
VVEATARPGRLHRLVHHGEQLGRQGVQINLVAEADAEGLHRRGRVVPAAVKAPVDHCLRAASGRLEQGRHDQGRPSHHPARRVAAHPAEQLPQHQHRAAVDGAQEGAERAVDQRAVDQPVDVVQPEAQDRDACSDRDQGDDQPIEHGNQAAVREQDVAQQQKHEHQRGGVGEPLELLALHPTRAAKPHHHREGRRARPTAARTGRRQACPAPGRGPRRARWDCGLVLQPHLS